MCYFGEVTTNIVDFLGGGDRFKIMGKLLECSPNEIF